MRKCNAKLIRYSPFITKSAEGADGTAEGESGYFDAVFGQFGLYLLICYGFSAWPGTV